MIRFPEFEFKVAFVLKFMYCMIEVLFLKILSEAKACVCKGKSLQCAVTITLILVE